METLPYESIPALSAPDLLAEQECHVLLLRRQFTVAVFACLLVLTSCGKSPKTFDALDVVSRGPVQTQSRIQNVNAMRAFDAAVLNRRQELAFIVAAIRAVEPEKEQPLSATSPPPTPLVAVAATSSGLGPCGGDLPPCYVKERESGGDYRAYNPTGCGGYSCGGAWQFDPRTWNNYGGYQYAQDAPPEVQDAKAREVYAGGAGASNWGVG